jgi:hypothetical protein
LGEREEAALFSLSIKLWYEIGSELKLLAGENISDCSENLEGSDFVAEGVRAPEAETDTVLVEDEATPMPVTLKPDDVSEAAELPLVDLVAVAFFTLPASTDLWNWMSLTGPVLCAWK